MVYVQIQLPDRHRLVKLTPSHLDMLGQHMFAENIHSLSECFCYRR